MKAICIKVLASNALSQSLITTTVRPLLTGHPRDFEKWPLYGRLAA